MKQQWLEKSFSDGLLNNSEWEKKLLRQDWCLRRNSIIERECETWFWVTRDMDERWNCESLSHIKYDFSASVHWHDTLIQKGNL